MLYPLLLAPIFKDYLWGGTKLKTIYHKQSDLAKIAESWELACHKEGINTIKNGIYKDRSFLEYLQEEGSHVFGRDCLELPLLIKLIDTEDSLSIQVHPDDEYAEENENGQAGKTELWYIMDCEPGATLFYGLAHEITKEEFKQRAADGTILEVLNRVEVRKGDAFLLKPGTVHAIGKNMTVAEIGTNSNITYRLYDFGRRDAQGNLRELHIEKAADVFHCRKPKIYNLNEILDCGTFQVEKLLIEKDIEFDLYANKQQFQVLICIEGEGLLQYKGGELRMPLGSTVFVPAGLGEYSLRGEATILKTTS